MDRAHDCIDLEEECESQIRNTKLPFTGSLVFALSDFWDLFWSLRKNDYLDF
jgi:hypothetical protein